MLITSWGRGQFATYASDTAITTGVKVIHLPSFPQSTGRDCENNITPMTRSRYITKGSNFADVLLPLRQL